MPNNQINRNDPRGSHNVRNRPLHTPFSDHAMVSQNKKINEKREKRESKKKEKGKEIFV
jgi:hypothetical protein